MLMVSRLRFYASRTLNFDAYFEHLMHTRTPTRHFILVDNGTQRLWQTEIDLRTRLEAALTMQAQKDDSTRAE